MPQSPLDSASAPTLAFLSGGGEMGALIRAHDWAATPLGPPQDWPQSLRSTLSACLNSPMVGSILWGPELRILYNHPYSRSMPDRHPHALGRPFAEVWGDGWGRVAPPFDHAMATGQGFRQDGVELPIVRQGLLETTYWNFIVTPIRGEDGGIVGLLSHGIEITDEHLLKLTQARSLSLYENIIQSDTTPICAFDTDYRLIAFNQAHNDEFYRVNGFYSKLGDVFCDLFVPEQRPAMRALMTRALTGEPFTVEEEFGNPEIHAPRWEIHYTPLRDETGKVVGAFHHARDISGRLRAQAELEVAQSALRQSQKMESLGQLTGGVAHDFNNLLTPIIGSLDLLSRRAGSNTREVRLIEGALQAAERAKTLVHRLLAFARRQPLQPGPVDLAALIGGMSELVAGTSGPRITVHTEVAAGLAPALADANQLEMAILNLCVNARDAMPDGGTITISAQPEPPAAGHPEAGFVRLAVTDTGVGMDDETARRAAEPFYSTKGIGKGTGLGLSMVDGLASQLGGSMVITSTPGQGTRVALLLPATRAVVPGPTAAVAPAAAILQGRVLIVDDEPLVRLATADMLHSLGYDVVEAGDARGAEAALAAGERFDLVVTDHLMPGMSGVDLAHSIRARWPDLPVLIVSGYADVDGISPDLPRLSKPFREAELAGAIMNAARR